MHEIILKYIGELVLYGGGSVAIAYGVFTLLGKRWIEKKFSESLENHKHLLKQELEQTKYKINTLFNRVTKIHEKEFEVLPSAWSMLMEAISKLTRFTSALKEYPNLDTMNEAQLNEFLKQSFLYDYQKDELKNSDKKVTYYQDKLFYYELYQAGKAIFDFHTYIQKNKLFLSNDIKNKFKEIDDIMWSAHTSMEIGKEENQSLMRMEAWKKTKNEIEPIKNEIEDLVQQRLKLNEA